jgi:hypothetical protein
MKQSLFQKIRKNHSLAMILCCAIPLGLLVVLSFTGRLGSWGYFALFLLCPLMHVFMMRGHGAFHHGGERELLPSPESAKVLEKLPEKSD